MTTNAYADLISPNLKLVKDRESLRGFRLDHHTLGRVSPLGYQWVRDCYAHGTWWASERLAGPQLAPQLRLLKNELWVGPSAGVQTPALGGLNQSLRVARQFEAKWQRVSLWNARNINVLVRESPSRDSMLVQFDHIRRYMVRIWRLHFLFQFALRQVHEAALHDLPDGVQEEQWIDSLSGWADASTTYVNECHRITNSLTYRFRDDDTVRKIVEAFIARRGNRMIRYLDVSEMTLLERPDLFSAIGQSSAMRQLKSVRRPAYVATHPILDAAWNANYLWWSEEHNADIEWKSLIPLRTSAQRAADFLEIPSDDIFFFYWPELIDALRRGSLDAELRERVRRRRHAWKATPPNDQRGTRTEWTGAGVGGGCGTGPALVCSEEGVDDRAAPGFILVTPGVSTSWLPLLSKAAGCVIVHAGLTSHGVILCRQLGIPCVVGVDRDIVSRSIAGTMLTVDASHGTVKQLSRTELR